VNVFVCSMAARRKLARLRGAMSKTSTNTVSKCDLFEERRHGADAQRGWSYQMIATACRAFDLDRTPDSQWTIRLEGLEDFDVSPVHHNGVQPSPEYVQVKSSKVGLDWTAIGKALASFVLDLQANPAATFVLVTNKLPTGTGMNAARFRQLGIKEKNEFVQKATQQVRKTFQSQDRDSSCVTETVVCYVLENLKTELSTFDALTDKLIALVSTCYRLDSVDGSAYAHHVTGQLFECARNRQAVDHSVLQKWKFDLDHLLRNAEEMKAVELHLVRSLKWVSDERPQDFSEGRQTRPGHIVDNLDIARSQWMDKISEAFNANNYVAICAASGEGKSTLALRYMHDNWTDATIVQIAGAESREEAEAISEHLEKLQRACGNVHVSLDNADHSTSEWPTVAAKCQALGIPMLVTARTEDWLRYNRPYIATAEVVRPVLDRSEASRLFKQMQKLGTLAGPDITAENAYAQVQRTGLLMEFMYYATHKTMLTDRLKQQLDELDAQKNPEDARAIRYLLMSVSLANVLDCGLERGRLLGNDPDDQLLRTHLLDTLSGEYLYVDGERVHGLHFIRSRDIVCAFHQSPTDLAARALGLLPLVPDKEVSRFILRASESDMIDQRKFLEGLIDAVTETRASTISAALDALHDIGERNLVKSNLRLFSAAEDEVGSQGPDMLTWFISPVDGSAFADRFEKEMRLGPEAAFWQLKRIAQQIDTSQRGKDLCRTMLGQLDPSGFPVLDASDLFGIGHLLQWCGSLQFRPKHFQEQLTHVVDSASLSLVSIEALASFSTGLFAWDRTLLVRWIERHGAGILEEYAKSSDCSCVSIEHEELHIEFLAATTEQFSNDASMRRLDLGRALFPHCSKYCSHGILVNAGMKSILGSTRNPTDKAIPVKNLPSEHDVWRNRSLTRAIQPSFGEATNAKYLKAWTNARKTVVSQFRNILDAAHQMLQVNSRNLLALKDPALKINDAYEHLPAQSPDERQDNAPDDTPNNAPTVKQSLPEHDWASQLYSFFLSLSDVIMDKPDRVPALLLSTTWLIETLRPMQESLKDKALLDPDRFEQLSAEELSIYLDVLATLRTILTNFPRVRIHAPQSYVAGLHHQDVEKALDRCKLLATKCRAQGVSIVAPTTIDIDVRLVSIPIGVNTADIVRFRQNEGRVVLQEMATLFEKDCVWLVPIMDGSTANDQGYQILSSGTSESSGKPAQMKDMWMLPVPPSLRQALPVPTGPEPFALTAMTACSSGEFCVATLVDIISTPKAALSEESSLRYVNAAAFEEATNAAIAGYRDACGQQLAQLKDYCSNGIEPDSRFDGVVKAVDALLALLQPTADFADVPALVSALERVQTLFQRIPIVSALVRESGNSDIQPSSQAHT
jgi:hypothetical protein